MIVELLQLIGGVGAGAVCWWSGYQYARRRFDSDKHERLLALERRTDELLRTVAPEFAAEFIPDQALAKQVDELDPKTKRLVSGQYQVIAGRGFGLLGDILNAHATQQQQQTQNQLMMQMLAQQQLGCQHPPGESCSRCEYDPH